MSDKIGNRIYLDYNSRDFPAVAHIDRLVCELCGLTVEERQIVEQL